MKISNFQAESIFAYSKQIDEDSKMGFFSKPFRITYQGEEFMLKKYKGINDSFEEIIALHKAYVLALKESGVQIPDTQMFSLREEERPQLCIFQKAFAHEQLLRNVMLESELPEFLKNLKLIFSEILNFWNKKPEGDNLGFHPTLRNYALVEGQLHYFDTFPPMNMSQQELNKFIIRVAPYGKFFKPVVPPFGINRVTNEYYALDKMILGIVGSCCRLRPEFVQDILSFISAEVANAEILEEIKKAVLVKTKNPPRLSLLWRIMRKLTGNTGAANVS
ncbi:MAG: hypothetical protein ACI8ZO_000786 [Flavobacteriales bacterium]|jgi:hypothetical protein